MSDWRTADGAMITEEEAERMAAAFEADDDVMAEAMQQPLRRRGRRPLKGTTAHKDVAVRSPKVEYRVGEDLYVELKKVAQREQRTVSAVAREAVEIYVKTHQK